MKNLFIFIICLFFVCCGDGANSSSESNYYDQDATSDPPVAVDPDEPVELAETGPIILSLLSDDSLYFYNGEFQLQENIGPKPCGNRCFTDESIKKFYGDYGAVESSEYMIIEPDFILDDWIVENIGPQYAYSMGAQARDYSRIYFQGIEVGSWFLNQWLAVDLIKTDSGEIIAIDQNSVHHVLTSEISDINHAKKLLIYDFDPVGKTAMINGDNVSWTTNYFNQAKDWQKSGNTWYSWNGYEYNVFLSEYANSMWSWNSAGNILNITNSTLLSAGTRPENSETVLYWIECNSGWLIKYIPSIDQVQAVFRLYQGDGERMTGVYNRDNLKPALVNGNLYFNESGSVWKVGIGSGVVELFFAGEGEVLGW